MAPTSALGPPPRLDGFALRVCIIHARWNPTLIHALVEGARSSMLANGVKRSNIVIHSVPGAYELPFACQTLCTPSLDPLGPQGFDAVIAIGVLIKGETMHFEYISEAVTQGLMRVQLDTRIPIVFGVLTLLDKHQGEARCGLGAHEPKHNHGEDYGRAAVELGMKRKLWTTGSAE